MMTSLTIACPAAGALRVLLLMASLMGISLPMTHAAETRLPVLFSGGHDTDPRDRGRPVNLVAAALGVTPEVFREAFSGVTPARRDGGPTQEEARRNKAALMKVLAPHGITNERLDEVSNYYRYRREAGEMWRNKAAVAEAVFENDVLKRVEIKEAGSGYSSSPMATIQGKKSIQLNVTLTFDKDLAKNGSIAKIEAAPPAK